MNTRTKSSLLLSAVIWLVILGSAFSDNGWLTFYDRPDEALEINFESIERTQPGFLRMWGRKRYKQPQTTEATGEQFDKITFYSEFDCSSKRVRSLSMHVYMNDSVIDSYENTGKWSYPPPDNWRWSVGSIFCSGAYGTWETGASKVFWEAIDNQSLAE